MVFSGSFGSSGNALTALSSSQLKVYIRRVDCVTGGDFGFSANPLALHGGLYNSGSPANPFNDGASGVDTPGSLIRTGGSSNTVNATLANNNSPSNNITDNSTANTNTTNEVVPVASKEISGIQGMLFTVQIGVYSNNVSASQLFNLNPIYREQIPSGNFRYTAGIYSCLLYTSDAADE